MKAASVGLLALTLLMGGCAALGALGQVIQAPRFAVARQYQPEIRIVGPSLQRPLGGATVRLWAEVSNPNPVSLVLSTLRGSLALEGVRAADVNFPLGLPLAAAGDTIVPLDIAVSFSELPGLANVIPGALNRGTVAYRLDGTVGVDAGLLGQPSFGPMTLLQGGYLYEVATSCQLPATSCQLPAISRGGLGGSMR